MAIATIVVRSVSRPARISDVSDLGLRRSAVRIVDHRPEWTATFHLEASTIWSCVGDIVVDVQHIGSTAIADVPAKPILDIAIAVRTREAIPTAVERLRQRGYIDRGDAGSEGGYLLVKESEPAVRTIHLHIVEAADSQWQNYIRLREILRHNPDIRRRYAELKGTLADRSMPEHGQHDVALTAIFRTAPDVPCRASR